MNLTLKRTDYLDEGVFGELEDESGKKIAVTLEHSYDRTPKIPAGVYTCVRGPHRLHDMTEDFETFEITGVEGHSGILFHWGNYNRDSEGCVLVGQSQVGGMITNSRKVFAELMALQDGLATFQLTVVG